MNSIEKRDFIHSHLHQVNEPELNELYSKMLSVLNEVMIEESEADIKNGDLISHKSLKQDILSWRPTK
jgi:hypothetical protein